MEDVYEQISYYLDEINLRLIRNNMLFLFRDDEGRGFGIEWFNILDKGELVSKGEPLRFPTLHDVAKHLSLTYDGVLIACREKAPR